MTATDVSGYVSLELFDITPQGLVDRAVAQAQATIPEWTPAEGQTEMVLIEAVAVMVAEAVYAINRLPGTVSEVLLRLFGLNRDAGAASAGAVTFTLADSTGYVIPAGSQLTVLVAGVVDPVLLVTLSDLLVPGGAASGTVAVGTDSPGSIANGTPVGTPCAILSPLPLVDSAQISTPLADGRDVEDARAFLDRAVGFLATLSSTLVRPEDFAAAAVATPGVGRATVADAYDPAVGPTVGDNPGHLTVLGLDEAGAALSTAAKTALLAQLVTRATADLTVHVADATVTGVAVVASVAVAAGFTGSAVQAAAVLAVQSWLDPASWPWAGVVYRNSLIGVLSDVPGVDHVISVTTPAADVTLSGAGPLASASSVTITAV